MGTIVAVANLKGGTGKTTVAVNVASALARRHDVVLVDADPQQAAAAWTHGAAPGLRARRHLMGSDGPGNGGGDADAAIYRRWLEAVRKAAATTDYLVIDLPPRLSGVVAAAFALADVVVVPVTPGGAEMRATRRTAAMIDRARRSRADGGPDCVLVPNRVDRRTSVGRSLDHALRELGEAVGPVLRQRAAHMSSFDTGAWVGAHAPESEALDEVEALVKYLRSRLSQRPASAASEAAESAAASSL